MVSRAAEAAPAQDARHTNKQKRKTATTVARRHERRGHWKGLVELASARQGRGESGREGGKSTNLEVPSLWEGGQTWWWRGVRAWSEQGRGAEGRGGEERERGGRTSACVKEEESREDTRGAALGVSAGEVREDRQAMHGAGKHAHRGAIHSDTSPHTEESKEKTKKQKNEARKASQPPSLTRRTGECGDNEDESW